MIFPLQRFLCGGLLAASLGRAGAQRLQLESVSLRFGVSANASSAAFHQLDAALKLDTPLSWDLGREWWTRLQAAVSAGWLGDPGHNALIVSMGPCALLGHADFPATLEGGISPAFLSQPDFETKNFGGNVQFTTYAGLNFILSSAVRLSYRFQHMSNAGFGSHNPGLNLHMFCASYCF